MLAIGQPAMDNFSDHPQAVIVYFFFVAATFFSNLAMLNMLIAIMGDSFNKVFENRDVNSTKMKLGILADLSAILPQQDDVEQESKFLIVGKCTEAQEDDTGEDWEGTLRRLTRVVEREGKQLEVSLGGQCRKLQDSLEDFGKKNSIQTRQLQAHVDKSIKAQTDKIRSDYRKEIDEVRNEVQGLHSKIQTAIEALTTDDE